MNAYPPAKSTVGPTEKAHDLRLSDFLNKGGGGGIGGYFAFCLFFFTLKLFKENVCN